MQPRWNERKAVEPIVTRMQFEMFTVASRDNMNLQIACKRCQTFTWANRKLFAWQLAELSIMVFRQELGLSL